MISENEANSKIEAFIFAERHSQKGIVIGEGRLIRKVQRESELELSNIYEKIDLKLKVKVERIGGIILDIKEAWLCIFSDKNYLILIILGGFSLNIMISYLTVFKIA